MRRPESILVPWTTMAKTGDIGRYRPSLPGRPSSRRRGRGLGRLRLRVRDRLRLRLRVRDRVRVRVRIRVRDRLRVRDKVRVRARVRVRVGVGVRDRVGLVHGRAAQRHLGPALTALSLQPHAWAGGRDGVRRRRERQRPTQDQSRLPHARGARRAGATLPAPRRRRGRRRGAHTTLIPNSRALPPRMPHHYTCHYTGASAAGRGARTAQAACPNPHPNPQAQPAQEFKQGEGWCGGGATLTGVSKA